MEDQIHGRSIDGESHSRWGTYLFDKNYGGPYIEHIDGKNYTGRQKTLPYMTSDEIVDLLTYIDRNSEVLEIGGGNSTVFLSRIVKKLVTIEHNLEWAEIVRSKVDVLDSDWTLYVVEPNWPQQHPFFPAENGQFNDYVRFISTLSDNQFDVILIDGRDRVRSSVASIPKLKKGGILLIHDFWNRKKYHSLLNLSEIELVVDSNSYSTSGNNTLVAFIRVV
jgi:hypothetical protein